MLCVSHSLCRLDTILSITRCVIIVYYLHFSSENRSSVSSKSVPECMLWIWQIWDGTLNINKPRQTSLFVVGVCRSLTWFPIISTIRQVYWIRAPISFDASPRQTRKNYNGKYSQIRWTHLWINNIQTKPQIPLQMLRNIHTAQTAGCGILPYMFV